MRGSTAMFGFPCSRRTGAVALLAAVLGVCVAPVAHADPWSTDAALALPDGVLPFDGVPWLRAAPDGGVDAVMLASGRDQLVASHQAPGVSWTPFVDLAPPEAQVPSVAALSGNGSLATWSAGGVVYASVREALGPWDGARRLSDPQWTCGSVVHAATTSDGSVVVAWERRDGDKTTKVETTTRRADGTWTPVEVLAGPQPGWSQAPVLAMAPDGGTLAVWQVAVGPDADVPSVVDAAYRPPGGPWQTPVTVSEVDRNDIQPVAALATGGRAVVAWDSYQGETGHIAATTRGADGRWAPPQSLGSDGDRGQPVADIDDTGRVVVAWPEQRPAGMSAVLLAEGHAGDALTAPRVLDGSVVKTVGAISMTGMPGRAATLLFDDTTIAGRSEVRLSRSTAPAAWTAASVLASSGAVHYALPLAVTSAGGVTTVGVLQYPRASPSSPSVMLLRPVAARPAPLTVRLRAPASIAARTLVRRGVTVRVVHARPRSAARLTVAVRGRHALRVTGRVGVNGAASIRFRAPLGWARVVRRHRLRLALHVLAADGVPRRLAAVVRVT